MLPTIPHPAAALGLLTPLFHSMPKARPDRTTRHVGAGLTMAVAVGLFSYGGHLLDQKLSTSPAFLLTGLVLGAVGGFLHLVNLVAPDLLPFRKKPRDREPPEDPDAQAR